jgi:hypothetical protein
MDQIYIGVDVAKAWLGIYHPARGAKRIENTPARVRSFARAAAREGVWVNRQDRPLSRRPACVPSLGDVQSVPAEAAGGRKTGESRFDRDGQEAAQRAQQHGRGRHLLQGGSANLNTVAGKPGAVQRLFFNISSPAKVAKPP